jgi:hypothetical protein
LQGRKEEIEGGRREGIAKCGCARWLFENRKVFGAVRKQRRKRG